MCGRLGTKNSKIHHSFVQSWDQTAKQAKARNKGHAKKRNQAQDLIHRWGFWEMCRLGTKNSTIHHSFVQCWDQNSKTSRARTQRTAKYIIHLCSAGIKTAKQTEFSMPPMKGKGG
jgi:hypothetical protein